MIGPDVIACRLSAPLPGCKRAHIFTHIGWLMAEGFALERKTAIVTGGAQGIGFAIAQRFVEEGMHVVLADIDDSQRHDAAERLGKIGEALYVHCDVPTGWMCATCWPRAWKPMARLMCWSPMPGSSTADFLDVEEADFDRVIGVNLKGVFLTCQAVAKHMVERVEAGEKPGTIITMSSVNAELAIPNQVPYVARPRVG
jgi:glucose 1-dehydrogenase